MQDVIADADLADVMKKGALDQGADRGGVETRRLGQMHGVQRDPIVVGVRVAVALRDGAAQHLDDLEICGQDALRETGQASRQDEDDRVQQQARRQHDQRHVGSGLEGGAPRIVDSSVGQCVQAFAIDTCPALSVWNGQCDMDMRSPVDVDGLLPWVIGGRKARR